MTISKLIFNDVKCKGCLLCAFVCPKGILEPNKERVNAKGYNPIKCTDQNVCIACAMCAFMCPDSVIEVRSETI